MAENDWRLVHMTSIVPPVQTPKQAIYTEILWWLLPDARNVQTMPWWQRLRIDRYPELELVHNIPPLLRIGEVDVHDVYWLNTQAQIYANACQKGRRNHDVAMLALIDALVALVPDSLKSALTYQRAGRSTQQERPAEAENPG
ncbi:hypothetical protein [Tahibacter amnicola]|uniref:Uncharacterized protein n=1 Tax=Tahibacter amnicola TaxID=2976241 RepID=A0ABY6BAR4_9GAMM|nr:hypothetical protein [Tahibacter amnicola]UXI66774.1 hypothetical protein N4264_18745 [Tahibacter amnicola]